MAFRGAGAATHEGTINQCKDAEEATVRQWKRNWGRVCAPRNARSNGLLKTRRRGWSGDDGDDVEEEEVEAKSAKAFLRLFTLLPKETKKKPEKNSQETVFDLFYTSTACGGF